jgi:chromosome partitioning protein
VIISVSNQKGGVGKTTTVFSLGSAFAQKGKKVLLVDLDPQSSLTISAGLEPQDIKVSVYDALVQSASLPIVQLNPNLALTPSNIGFTQGTSSGRDS